jgi:hypothetical protein
MPALGGQTFIELSREITLWHADLPALHRELVEAHWRRLAQTPELSILEDVDGEPIRMSFVKIDDGRVWGYRFAFIVDEVTQVRAKMPAIKVSSVKTLRRRRS